MYLLAIIVAFVGDFRGRINFCHCCNVLRFCYGLILFLVRALHSAENDALAWM